MTNSAGPLETGGPAGSFAAVSGDAMGPAGPGGSGRSDQGPPLSPGLTEAIQRKSSSSWWRVPLRLKILVLLFLVTASLTLVFWVIATTLIREETENTFASRLRGLTAGLAATWDDERLQMSRTANLLARAVAVEARVADVEPARLGATLRALAERADVAEIDLTLASGTRIHSHRYEVDRVPWLRDDSARNISRVVTEAAGGRLDLVATVPLYRDGRFFGQLQLRRPVDNGRVLRWARVLQADITVISQRRMLATSIASESRGDMQAVVFATVMPPERLFTGMISGQPHAIGWYEPPRGLGEEPVRLLCSLSQQTMLTLLDEARRNVLVAGLLTLAIAFILAAIFSERVLTRRIHRLREGALKLAQGVAVPTDFAAGGNDELGDLGGAFVRMATTIRQTEDNLRHRNEDLQLFVNSVENMKTYIQNILASLETGVITWNDDWRAVTVNAGAHRLLDDVYADVQRLSLRALLRPMPTEHRRRVLAAIRQLLRRDEPQTFEFAVRLAGKLPRTFIGRFTHLRDADGVIYGRVLTLDDLTEQRMIEQQLFHADKMASIGQMAASVAHEIKNPLASIKTLGQVLGEELPAGDSRREYVEVIVSEVNRLNRVVEQLLRFARPEAGEFKRTPLLPILEAVVALVDHEAERHRVHLAIDVPVELMVVVDGEKMQQVFLNLLINAIQAMPAGGTVTVRARVETGRRQVCVEVADTGPGMSLEVQQRLFEPFFTTKQRGTGLGLAIVRKIVELHGGQIGVESAPTGGSTFRMRLPAGP